MDPQQRTGFLTGSRLAHPWLVANPPYHSQGDFGLSADGLGLADGVGPDGQRCTSSNIALCCSALFGSISPRTRAYLGPLTLSYSPLTLPANKAGDNPGMPVVCTKHAKTRHESVSSALF